MRDDLSLAVGAQRRLPDLDYAHTDLVVHVVICAAGRRPVFGDERLCRAVVASLDWLRHHRAVSLYAWCLMPDHLHLLLRLGDGSQSLGAVIGAMKSFTTRESWRLGYHGQLWQDRFYDHVLRAAEDVPTVGAYIRANPVRRGLVADPDAYPWSGAPDPW